MINVLFTHCGKIIKIVILIQWKCKPIQMWIQLHLYLARFLAKNTSASEIQIILLTSGEWAMIFSQFQTSIVVKYPVLMKSGLYKMITVRMISLSPTTLIRSNLIILLLLIFRAIMMVLTTGHSSNSILFLKIRIGL